MAITTTPVRTIPLRLVPRGQAGERRYHIWTSGCQMNKADSEHIGGLLEQAGYVEVGRPEAADVVVLNSCVVRQSAEDRAIGQIHELRALKQRNPKMVLGVTGCLVEEDDRPLRRRFPHVDQFFNARQSAGFLRLVLERQGNLDLVEWVEGLAPAQRPASASNVTAWVNVIYGCNHRCTYCIVPYRRGRQESRPIAEIVAEVEGLVAGGVKEVTLLGQIVNAYGRDLPGRPELADLLEAVNGIAGLERIRFLTSHPLYVTERLARSFAELDKVCEHFDLPVQSGDDHVLKVMKRAYTVAHYRRAIADVRAACPGIGLSTDVIVGYPGETEAEFEHTYRLIEEVRVDTVHVAEFSPRRGTPAAAMPDDVPHAEKERRRRTLEALQERIAGEINARLVGTRQQVLVEERSRGRWKGRTRTNKLVFFDDLADLAGQVVEVEVTQASPWFLSGAWVPATTAPSG